MKDIYISKMNTKLSFLVLSLYMTSALLSAQKLPAVLSGIQQNQDAELYLVRPDGTMLFRVIKDNAYTLSQMQANPVGTEKGIDFDFGREDLSGTMIYGLIHYEDSKYPMPVYRSSPIKISEGKASLDLDALRGRYDMTGWEKSGLGTIGYRVMDQRGTILYDGIVSFSGKEGPFKVINSIQNGPFINLLQPEGPTISFITSQESIGEIIVDNKVFKDPYPVIRHEIKISGLKADSLYKYTVKVGKIEQSYSFHTSPLPGSRKKFVFAYSSDSRGGSGGGERNLYGANVYIMKKNLAASANMEIVFSQFTGDLINGYSTTRENMMLQYRNWYNAVSPFAHHFPVIAAMGNHESYKIMFQDTAKKYRIDIGNYPYSDNSSESLFAEVAVNPHNGPLSEDGSAYDPDPEAMNFPTYDENVFYYTYDNMAMVVLNSNYWYTPSTSAVPFVGGNIHSYVMDKQLEWFEASLGKLEKDDNIDHIFVTIHTPFFPNGGHVERDMWFHGNNSARPYVSGKAVKKGIIERRDQLLDLAVNKSSKVVALLTGDEHNYCKTKLGPETIIYNDNYKGKKIRLKRSIYQVNNGAGGAPYYAQQETPWTPFTTGFTTQNALCFFTVEGPHVSMKVINPDTLEEIDSLDLK